MKVRAKHPELKGLIQTLHKKGVEEGAPIWSAVSRGLNRPNRKAYEVNLHRLDKYAKKRETIVVPGAVLGSGDITKPLTVAALKFSSEAERKIRKAGGKTMDIEELVSEKPKGKGVRIMG
jgi:large subunit ribosomal protein L18e